MEIKPYQETDREQLLDVWEKSVLATHHFLSPEDFISIKAMVREIDFSRFEVHCLMDESRVIGFLGVEEKKVEMLFLDPHYFGQGLGKKLINFAIVQLKAHKVDVNEQNVGAVAFYENLGFATYERRDKDDQGNDYPILRMKLRTRNI
ncbi:GNAT family N-acetyltransferase [Marinoscillum luteum]|uniref:GNAT family N-acetyltransferase n=1 Tax=Marinoscillum luteum TaxID=861051 RepID=A0ABW7N671_9BACT